MINPINNEEEEWVEISDMDGRKAAMRHIATVRYDGNIYFILGAVRQGGDGEEAKGLLLVRMDEEEDGSVRYTATQDEGEIEHVIGSCVLGAILSHLSSEGDEAFPSFEGALPCAEQHGPMEFCYCDESHYLQ